MENNQGNLALTLVPAAVVDGASGQQQVATRPSPPTTTHQSQTSLVIRTDVVNINVLNQRGEEQDADQQQQQPSRRRHSTSNDGVPVEAKDKRDRLWRSKTVLQNEDVLKIACYVDDWKELARRLGLPEHRVAAWERQAMEENGNLVEGGGSSYSSSVLLAKKRMLLAWLQKDDLNATVGMLLWKLDETKEWAAIIKLPEQ